MNKTSYYRKNGEMIVRELSQKAQDGYYGTSPIDIYYDDCTEKSIVVLTGTEYHFNNTTELQSFLECLL